MADLDLKTKENKVRLFIAENVKRFHDLMLIKQADFSACKDDISPAPTVIKWQKIYDDMKKRGLPFSVKELNITADDLIAAGVRRERLGDTMKTLLKKVITGKIKNEKQAILSAMAKL